MTGPDPTLARMTHPLSVRLQPSSGRVTDDQGLWVAIRNRTQAISFDRYDRFILAFLSHDAGNPSISPRGVYADGKQWERIKQKRDLIGLTGVLGADAYNLLRLATEAFLLFEAGLVFYDPASANDPDEDLLLRPDPGLIAADELEANGESERLGIELSTDRLKEKLNEFFQGKVTLPYLDRIIIALAGGGAARRELAGFEKMLQLRQTSPSMIELIWSYWHEEGMLVQSMNAVALRFQNRRAAGARDPLADLELDSLRPLNNVLWGYVQSAYTRLTLPRRAYEYDHHYGLTLIGKAVPTLRSADSRSKFLEAFHNVLLRASVFYREDADTTVVADAFPLLNSLRELHMVLAEGAHNQFGDLPWTARAEMMVEQWMLARPEMREFLRGRAAVPYQERWIGTVDAMTRVQGWGEANASQFHELAVTGEQLLLTARYHDWSDVHFTEEQAKNWARYWKNEVQRYVHSYRAVTGVDLTSEPVDARAQSDRYLQPSTLLRQRMESRRDEVALAAAPATRSLSSGNPDATVPISSSRGLAVRKTP